MVSPRLFAITSMVLSVGFACPRLDAAQVCLIEAAALGKLDLRESSSKAQLPHVISDFLLKPLATTVTVSFMS